MTTRSRRITAPKPERRRDVSGFEAVTRPTAEPAAAPSESPSGGFADWLADDEPLEVTIDLRADEDPVQADRTVDVEILLADDDP